ncbi:hypothetical protein ZWY2020_031860 [Hordeum vulgare]|nr:hypothetical protein ZWY2020_031860 [Hordeum vulgare]
MGVAARSLLARRKVRDGFSSESGGSGMDHAGKIVERLREGMDRIRLSFEGKISDPQPSYGGLDWSLVSGQDQASEPPVRMPNLKLMDNLAPMEHESLLVWREQGVKEGNQIVEIVIDSAVCLLPDQEIQYMIQSGAVPRQGHAGRKVKVQHTEEGPDLLGGERDKMIWEINFTQTGDPPDKTSDWEKGNTDILPLDSQGEGAIRHGGSGGQQFASNKHTIHPQDGELKKMVAASTLEALPLGGDERGSRRVERGSPSHRGGKDTAMAACQVVRSVVQGENRGTTAVELDLPRARAAMATRWLAVGYFFSVLPFSTVGLFGELKSKWGLRGRLSYTPLRNNHFMLEFERESDRRHVLENGPWTHRKDAFLIVPFDGQGKASNVEVNTMPIWARIYDVPPLMLSEEIGWKLGGLLGEVLRVDADKFGNIFFEFLRAWTAPAKMAWDSLGKEKEKEDTNCSQEMVRYRRVPDEVLLDPIVQAVIAAVSKLKVSDGPEHGDTRKLSVGENSMKPLENIPETVASTPAVATATTGTISTPHAEAVIGNDIDTTPDAHTVLEAATPPFPPGFGPDVVFKASPNAAVYTVVGEDTGKETRQGNRVKAVNLAVQSMVASGHTCAPVMIQAGTNKDKLKTKFLYQFKGRKGAGKGDSILGKRNGVDTPVIEAEIGSERVASSDMCKKKRADEKEEGESNKEELGGK